MVVDGRNLLKKLRIDRKTARKIWKIREKVVSL